MIVVERRRGKFLFS